MLSAEPRITVPALPTAEPSNATSDTGPTSDVDRSDLFEVVDCPFCTRAEHTPVTGAICDGPHYGVAEPYRSLAFRIVRCDGCGLLYQRERLLPESLSIFYDDEEYFCYQSFEERGAIIRFLGRLTARRAIRMIETLRNPDHDRFLDFGCGNGSWLELFRSCGATWPMVGAELTKGNVDHIRKLGFDGVVCDASNVDQRFEPGSLGVIHIHHVIEHVPSPLDLLRKLRRLLAPGGIIVGQTPNADCLERRLFGDAWTQWHLPQHLVVFEEPTLRRHAEDENLEVVSVRGSPSSATQWSASFLKARANRRGRIYRFTNEPLHGPLTLLAAPFSVLQARVHRTSHMDFVFRKPYAADGAADT